MAASPIHPSAPAIIAHTENFPVASVLLPRHLRAPVAAIYRFARSADDIADEGTASPEERLTQLQRYEEALDAIESGRPVADDLVTIFQPLQVEHEHTGFPLTPCRTLLSAFMQDVRQSRYATYSELLDYCARSANPVGHLMLFLFEADTPQNRVMSDAICTALQLTNHWQDLAIDANNGAQGRIYLPQDELALWAFTDDELRTGTCIQQHPERWAAFMALQTARVRALFDAGQDLPAILRHQSWRIGQELRLTVAGGRRILDKIDAVGGNVFTQRPSLRWHDWLQMLLTG